MHHKSKEHYNAETRVCRLARGEGCRPESEAIGDGVHDEAERSDNKVRFGFAPVAIRTCFIWNAQLDRFIIRHLGFILGFMASWRIHPREC